MKSVLCYEHSNESHSVATFTSIGLQSRIKVFFFSININMNSVIVQIQWVKFVLKMENFSRDSVSLDLKETDKKRTWKVARVWKQVAEPI